MNNITILLSTYNGTMYLKDQLDSLASQSCKEFFIIARDDGSTDASYGMLQNFMQHTSLHVKVLEERTNCGAVRKMWWAKDTLVQFWHTSYLLSKSDSLKYYDECFAARK